MRTVKLRVAACDRQARVERLSSIAYRACLCNPLKKLALRDSQHVFLVPFDPSIGPERRSYPADLPRNQASQVS